MIVCAWCNKVLDDSPETVEKLKGKKSHSICPSCHTDTVNEFKERFKLEEKKGIQGVK